MDGANKQTTSAVSIKLELMSLNVVPGCPFIISYGPHAKNVPQIDGRMQGLGAAAKANASKMVLELYPATILLFLVF